MDKLIKSFVVLKSENGLEKGEKIVLRKYQAEVPLNQEELCFESENGKRSYTFKFLKSEIGNSVKVHECFASIHEKFDYIS